MEEDWEEEQSQYVLAIFLKILWTSLVIIVVFGGLVLLTIFLGWGRLIFLGILGLLSGISITVAVLTSAKVRDLIVLLFGVLILPGLAAFLGSVAVKSQVTFNAYSFSLTPFVTYAVGVIISGLAIAEIWRERPMAGKEKRPSEVVGKISLEKEPARPEAKAEEETRAEEGVRIA